MKTELLPSESTQIVLVGVPTPMDLLQMAVTQGADLDKLQKLMELQERWEANMARKAFNASFAAFKSEAVTLLRTKEITDGPLKGKKHVELGGIVKAATPALSKHGLSISWKLSRDEKDWMEVACTLRHVDGHSESVSMGAAPDSGPGRNAIQARGSAKTYLERYTATAILGLAPEDDEDGQSGPSMPEAEVVEILDAIRAARNVNELQQFFTSGYKKAEAAGDRKAMGLFIGAKDKRKAELSANR